MSLAAINANFAEIAKEISTLEKEFNALKTRVVNAPLIAGRHVTHTIAAGIIAVTAPHILLVPESGLTDELNTINGGADGKIILLSLADPTYTITINDTDVAGGNIDIHSNGYVLNHINASCVLYFNGVTSKWHLFGVPLLDDIRNVNIISPAIEHYLGFDGTDWINRQIDYSEIGGITPTSYPGDEYIQDLTAAQLTGNLGQIQFVYDDADPDGAIAAILDVSAADKYLYSTAENTWAEGDITAFMRGLLDDVDAAAARTTLEIVAGGAGDIWVEKAGDAMTGNLAIATINTVGAALAVSRNLAAASTDSPVVTILQDEATDDQAALRVIQDGTGNIAEFYDASDLNVFIEDGGRLNLRKNDSTLYSATASTGAHTLLMRNEDGTTGVKASIAWLVTGAGLSQVATLEVIANGSGFAPDVAMKVRTGPADYVEVWRVDSAQRLLVRQTIRALTSGGLSLEDDGGNLGVFIEDGGHVGIGHNAPTVILDARENVNNASRLQIRNDNAGTIAQALFQANNGTGSFQAGMLGTGYSGSGITQPNWAYFQSSGADGLLIRTLGAFPLVLATDNTRRLTIIATGEIGIGTASPSAPLHIYQNNTETGATGGVIIEQDGTGDAYIQFLLTSLVRWVVGADNSDSDKFKISPTADLSSGIAVSIDTSGNVEMPANLLLQNNTQYQMRDAGGTARTVLWMNASDELGIFNNSGGNGGPIVFNTKTGGGESVRIDANGVLMVGLTSVGASILGVKAGNSANDAAVGGVLYTNTTTVGNVGVGEDDLMFYSIPADTLAANGQSIWFEAMGYLPSVAVFRDIRVRFGGTLLVGRNYGGTELYWSIKGRIIRTGAATQRVEIDFMTNDGAGGTLAFHKYRVNTTITLSSPAILKITGEGTNNNDVQQNTFIVGWDDDNL